LSARYLDDDDADLSSLASPVVEVVFARRKKSHLLPTSVTLQIDDLGYDDLIDEIYKKSYPCTRPNKSILVLINPHGGKGKAMKLFLKKAKPILIAANAKVEVVETKYSKHATDIARELDINKYDMIACASGDGVPYEVFNGFYERSDRAEAFNKVPVTQIPCGSGNAMAESCLGTSEPSFAALAILKASDVSIDLMAVTQDNHTTVSFLSQTFGFIADGDLGTEYLRFLGSIRFDLGVAYKMLLRARYPCEISIKYAAKSKDELRVLYHDYKNGEYDNEEVDEVLESNLKLRYDPNGPIPEDWENVNQDFADNIGIFYTGAMPYVSKDVQFFPAALPNDGSFDLVMMDGRTSLTRQTPILLSLESGKHVTAPEVQHSKVLAYRLTPKYSDGLLSVDGERYPLKPLQVEVLPKAAKTLMKNGTYVETNF
jgi:sphingosine kinase